MKVIGETLLLLAVTISAAACSSSDPRSPILGRDADPSPGPRQLTASQSRALRKAITSAGETCGAIIGQAFLRGIDPVDVRESWEVQCTEGPYAVALSDDGTQPVVRRCVGGGFGESPCAERRLYMEHRSYGDHQPPGDSPLSPELKKLLEPMTAKDGKTD